MIQQERGLLEKEDELDELIEEERKLRRVTDAYGEHFYEAKRFIAELGYVFHKNEERSKYEAMIDEFSMESRKTYEQLEDSIQDLYQEK